MHPVIHALARSPVLQEAAAAALEGLRHAKLEAASSSSSSSSDISVTLVPALILFNDICLSLHSLINGTNSPSQTKPPTPL